MSLIISFLVGTLVEEEDALSETMELSYKIAIVNPSTTFFVNAFSPITEIEMLKLPDVRKMYKYPETIEGRAGLTSYTDMFFKDSAYKERVVRCRLYQGLIFKEGFPPRESPVGQLVSRAPRKGLLYRLRHGTFSSPLELYMRKVRHFLKPKHSYKHIYEHGSGELR